MATILDAGLLQNFSIFFSFVFVIAIVYGILTFTKVFGESKGLQVLIAFIVGLMVLLVPDVNRLITTMVPWFTTFFVFILFLLIAYKIFGATDADIMGALKENSTIVWVVGIVFVVILIGSFGSVYGQKFLAGQQDITSGSAAGSEGTGTPDYSSNVAATFFHPKVLGMLFILILGVFTVAILAVNTAGGH
ncbi:MAG TPA: hypothetical protein VJI75_01640 [Candidatus Nanoarchaeia archaeon]|nr:hypothetical protein [Candidatus Nanoarchaeia archaeon]